MKIEVHKIEVPSSIRRQLEKFESRFTYPLGDARFRISHCGDYARFFRAMGECAVITACTGSRVAGVLAITLRRLILADGTPKRVAYFGDLKIAPAARGGFVLARLGQAARDWIDGQVDAALGIAMDGTELLPTTYTGRVGVPLFERVAQVAVLRARASPGASVGMSGAVESAIDTYQRLSAGSFALPVEDTSVRSVIPATALCHPDGLACGIVEDTRRGKRLYDDNGHEILSAHLSAFAYREASAGAALVREACSVAAQHDLPALFFSVPMKRAPELLNELKDLEVQQASASIYAANLGGGDWNINTSEI